MSLALRGVRDIRSQVSGLRSQVSGLRSQVSGLRSQVSGLRSQVSGLRARRGPTSTRCAREPSSRSLQAQRAAPDPGWAHSRPWSAVYPKSSGIGLCGRWHRHRALPGEGRARPGLVARASGLSSRAQNVGRVPGRVGRERDMPGRAAARHARLGPNRRRCAREGGSTQGGRAPAPLAGGLPAGGAPVRRPPVGARLFGPSRMLRIRRPRGAGGDCAGCLPKLTCRGAGRAGESIGRIGNPSASRRRLAPGHRLPRRGDRCCTLPERALPCWCRLVSGMARGSRQVGAGSLPGEWLCAGRV